MEGGYLRILPTVAGRGVVLLRHNQLVTRCLNAVGIRVICATLSIHSLQWLVCRAPHVRPASDHTVRKYILKYQTATMVIKNWKVMVYIPSDASSRLVLENCFNLIRLPRGDVLIVWAATMVAASLYDCVYRCAG